jgi:hypothetical protein
MFKSVTEIIHILEPRKLAPREGKVTWLIKWHWWDRKDSFDVILQLTNFFTFIPYINMYLFREAWSVSKREIWSWDIFNTVTAIL